VRKGVSWDSRNKTNALGPREVAQNIIALKILNNILSVAGQVDNIFWDIFCSLPYVPGLSGKLKRILQNNDLKVALRGSNTLASFLNFGKDRTSVEQQSGFIKSHVLVEALMRDVLTRIYEQDCYNIIILVHRL